MASTHSNIEPIFDAVISKYRGPGGAIAVLRNGQVVGQRVWGYADLEKRIAMTVDTIMPICSISKQFFCQLLVALKRHLSRDGASQQEINARLRDTMREVMGHDFTEANGLTIQNLCDNQSGIRDYWAMCILWGAKPESRFSRADDGPRALERTRTLHFEPGTEYSYCNLNFYIVACVIEILSGATLADLLEKNIFTPAGMKTAKLCPDTAQQPGPCVGYEGGEKHGYRPALNHIEWAGDAGVVASLEDMIAYECYVDRSSSDTQSIYHAIAQPQSFNDGTKASYHNGLFEVDFEGPQSIGHGGALRGYRLQRLYLPTERLSVVVMFNHEADPAEAAKFILRQLLKLAQPVSANIAPSEGWSGYFLDDDTNLVVAVTPSEAGRISVTYAGGPETMSLIEPQYARSPSMEAWLKNDKLRIDRLVDHRTLTATRLTPGTSTPSEPLVGMYRCAEIDSNFQCHGSGSTLYGSFDGFLGNGPMHLMRYVGGDVWLLACPRGPDAPAPGDWTLVFNRNGSGDVIGLTIGCWLARGLKFLRNSSTN